ncbi:hypothetical protein TrLO_g2477 [Triparma laevis f. longispina]|uniref:PX domain-containing protein n=1 Tax=Triparma laevis f. longispina TaxID=1714387 RepID=A0A9W7KWR8_9STRA|nr:hypothetical protein TrLO_g2477 [Triparma laevis f. longispina]
MVHPPSMFISPSDFSSRYGTDTFTVQVVSHMTNGKVDEATWPSSLSLPPSPPSSTYTPPLSTLFLPSTHYLLKITSGCSPSSSPKKTYVLRRYSEFRHLEKKLMGGLPGCGGGGLGRFDWVYRGESVSIKNVEDTDDEEDVHLDLIEINRRKKLPLIAYRKEELSKFIEKLLCANWAKSMKEVTGDSEVKCFFNLTKIAT